MPTIAAVIEETKRLLLAGGREERNKLNGLLTNVATSITMTYPLNQIKRGAKLSIDLEDIYAWDTSSLTVSPVDRGQFGSAAADHANGTVVHVNSKFSPWEIFNAMNDEINALSAAGLFRIITTELTYNPSVSGYNFAPSTIMDIYEVRYGVPGPSLEYPISTDWEFTRDMSDEFASGGVLFVRDAFPYRTVLVKAKVGFSEMAASMTNDVSTSFLPVSAYDLLSIGAAWRLSIPRELKRNYDEAQGDTRRADEVPPGANLGGSRELARYRAQRISEEITRLNQQYPRRMKRYTFI